LTARAGTIAFAVNRFSPGTTEVIPQALENAGTNVQELFDFLMTAASHPGRLKAIF
jgi:hypothetical protein